VGRPAGTLPVDAPAADAPELLLVEPAGLLLPVDPVPDVDDVQAARTIADGRASRAQRRREFMAPAYHCDLMLVTTGPAAAAIGHGRCQAASPRWSRGSLCAAVASTTKS
jgi:hypothetical protein